MKTQVKTEARTRSPSKAQDRPTASPALVATLILSLGMSSSQAQPANDLFANRIILTGTNIVATGSNVGATKEPGEPNHADETGGASVWWEWTAPTNDTVTITTSGSSFDTLLGVYTGPSVSVLTTIASNDDDADIDDVTSKVTFVAISNQTYQIAMDGYDGDSGSVKLRLAVGPSPPLEFVDWFDNVVAWGVLDKYRIPHGPWVVEEVFVPVGLSNVVAVAAGDRHSLALTAAGQVFAWGFYHSFYSGLAGGQVVFPAYVPVGLSNVVAIEGGGCHSLALTSEGRVVAWGRGRIGQSLSQTIVPVGLTNVVAVAAGGDHSLALTADGRVVAWGANSSGETNVPGGLSNVIAIAAGGIVDYGGHSLALTAEGRVVAWGDDWAGQATVPNGLSNVVAIAAGGEHRLALTTGGRVIAWGDNYYGQTNVPAGLSNVVGIAAGAYHSLALTSEGRVVAWGENWAGQATVPGWLSNVVAIAAGGGDSSGHCLALTRHPTVPAPGLEFSRGASGLELWGHGAPGISCQLLRSSGLSGPWLPTQPVTFTNNVQLLKAPDTSAPAQFYRLLRK